MRCFLYLIIILFFIKGDITSYTKSANLSKVAKEKNKERD